MVHNYQSSVFVWGSRSHGALGCKSPTCSSKNTIQNNVATFSSAIAISATASASTGSIQIQSYPIPLSPCCIRGYAYRPREPSNSVIDGAICQNSTSYSGELIDPDNGQALLVIAGNGTTTVITDRWEAFSWGNAVGTSSFNGGIIGNRNDRKRRSLAKGFKNSAGELTSSGKCCRSIRRLQVTNAMDVAHGPSHSCSVTLEGRVYGWGEDWDGCIAEGASANDKNKVTIKSSAGGNSGAAVMTTQRRKMVKKPRLMSTTLSNSKPATMNRQCTNSSRNDYSRSTNNKIYKHLDDAGIIATACGDRHTLLLQNNGNLLSMGANNAGQLGIGSNPVANNGWVHCVSTLTNTKFIEIACGNNHCAGIEMVGGFVLTWGWGQFGRLGHGDESMQNKPCRVETLAIQAPFVSVACGSAHTLAVSEGGNVYGFGWNAHFQVICNTKPSSSSSKNLGKGAVVSSQKEIHSGTDCYTPVTCLERKGIVKASCGFAHSAAISASGKLYMWGMNDEGQCGVGHDLPLSDPTEIDFPDNMRVVYISCGHSHTVCICSNYYPLEAKKWRKRLLQIPHSARVIVRFVKHAMFRLRVNKLLNSNKSKIFETLSDEQHNEVDKETINDEPPDDASSSSSCSSLLDYSSRSNLGLKPGNDELTDRVLEMRCMSIEDACSQKYRDNLREMKRRTSEAKERRIQEENSELERRIMEQEDMFSKYLRDEISLPRMESKQTKAKLRTKSTNEINKSLERATRTQTDIQKTAERLKAAREKKERLSKLILPAVKRKPPEKQSTTFRRSALNDLGNEATPVIEEDNDHRRERRSKLIQRRERRLENIERERAEAMARKRRQMIAEQEIESMRLRLKKIQLEKEQRMKVEAGRLRLARKAQELALLQSQLFCQEGRREDSKENRCPAQFRDVKHWTKRLSGTT
mmetsp:Transcript_1089/g.2286  ORF Transcript_1089/g.2286 Transcript_1089/m.2286 type:complete len:921 (+) Transcript_1089:671-3433(+)